MKIFLNDSQLKKISELIFGLENAHRFGSSTDMPYIKMTDVLVKDIVEFLKGIK